MEGVVLDGLRRRGVAAQSEEARLEVASRTDRGVSARANALTLSSGISGAALLDRLNAISPELFFTDTASVPDQFRVRSAARRVYRYFEPGAGRRPGTWEGCAHLFRGRVDVRSFGRGIPASSPQWRTVESLRVQPVEGGRMVEVRAPSFVWGMVRKIIGALREVDQGHLTPARLASAIAGRERLTLPLAPAEGLVLWEVDYPAMRWDAHWSGENRVQGAWARQVREALWQRTAVLRTLEAEESKAA